MGIQNFYPHYSLEIPKRYKSNYANNVKEDMEI